MIVLDSGFHAVDSGFQLLDSGFQLSGFRIPKGLDSNFFFCFNAFLRISFSRSNLAILKDVVRTHNKFVFFFRFINYGKNVLRFRKGLWSVIMNGTLGDCPHRNAAEKKK